MFSLVGRFQLSTFSYLVSLVVHLNRLSITMSTEYTDKLQVLTVDLCTEPCCCFSDHFFRVNNNVTSVWATMVLSSPFSLLTETPMPSMVKLKCHDSMGLDLQWLSFYVLAVFERCCIQCGTPLLLVCMLPPLPCLLQVIAVSSKWSLVICVAGSNLASSCPPNHGTHHQSTIH